MERWHPFPHNASEFDYPGERLAEAWPHLHRGDGMVFPDPEWVARQLEEYPEAAPAAFDGNLAQLAADIRQAWRCFHGGDFQGAVARAERCGYLAHAAANKAAGIYATYLEPDEGRRREIFLNAVERAERAAQVLPDDPNTHYFLAFNLGRYSQSISVMQALRQGVGARIQQALETTLTLAPEHSEAHTAFGMYHAEVIDKVGKMIGAMTYGASIEAALEHFERALELTPDSPIARIECANGLYLLFGERRLDEVTELYVRASEMSPKDAMEKLDVEAALAELE